jgi:hypothetical protein
MASGDSGRTWFPELVDALRASWRSDLSWAAIIGLEATAYWSALYGTYANWVVTTLAAIFGTAALSPITGAGHSGQPLAGRCDRWLHERRDSNSCLFHPGSVGSAANRNAVTVPVERSERVSPCVTRAAKPAVDDREG